MARSRVPANGTAYNTMDRFGNINIKYDCRGGPQLSTGSNRIGAGTWWPDFGPTTNDFGYLYHAHPTETVFDHCVAPFSRDQKRQQGLEKPEESDPAVQQFRHPGAPESRFQQFRHPQPEREAMYKSTIIMPYKKGGRRKVDDDNHFKAALGGRSRYPIWCKGPLLNDPDRHQVHKLNRGDEPNIMTTCTREQLAAGTPTGTIPREALERSISAPALDPTKSTLLSPACGSTLRSLPGIIGGRDEREMFHRSIERKSLGKTLGMSGDVQEPPKWLAPRTVATRDPDAAGHAGCVLKKIPIERQ